MAAGFVTPESYEDVCRSHSINLDTMKILGDSLVISGGLLICGSVIIGMTKIPVIENPQYFGITNSQLKPDTCEYICLYLLTHLLHSCSDDSVYQGL